MFHKQFVLPRSLYHLFYYSIYALVILSQYSPNTPIKKLKKKSPKSISSFLLFLFHIILQCDHPCCSFLQHNQTLGLWLCKRPKSPNWTRLQGFSKINDSICYITCADRKLLYPLKPNCSYLSTDLLFYKLKPTEKWIFFLCYTRGLGESTQCWPWGRIVSPFTLANRVTARRTPLLSATVK